MKRSSLTEVVEAVRLVDLFITLHPGYPLGRAVDVICDLEGIADDRDRRIVRHGIEVREALLASTRRAAA